MCLDLQPDRRTGGEYISHGCCRSNRPAFYRSIATPSAQDSSVREKPLDPTNTPPVGETSVETVRHKLGQSPCRNGTYLSLGSHLGSPSVPAGERHCSGSLCAKSAASDGLQNDLEFLVLCVSVEIGES
jgi:hypothetical protein